MTSKMTKTTTEKSTKKQKRCFLSFISIWILLFSSNQVEGFVVVPMPSSLSSLSFFFLKTNQNGFHRDHDHFVLYNSRNNKNKNNNIWGLIDYRPNVDDDENGDTNGTFEALQATHFTLQELGILLPRLLWAPISQEQMKQSHTLDTQVVVMSSGSDDDGVVLVSNIEELCNLQNVLTFAVLGPLRASQSLLLLGSAGSGAGAGAGAGASRSNAPKTRQPPTINCDLIVLDLLPEDQGFTAIHQIQVNWNVSLVLLGAPGIFWDDSSRSRGGSTTTAASASALEKIGASIVTTLQGQSVLELKGGKIARHVLQRIQLDGKTVDASAVAKTLGLARKWVSQVTTNSPNWVKELIVPNVQTLWQQYAKPWILKEQGEHEPGEESYDNLNPSNGVRSKRNETNTIANSISLVPILVKTGRSDDKTRYISLDEACANRTFPLPGSSFWNQHAVLHSAVLDFANTVVPQLANPRSNNNNNIINIVHLFSRNCKLVATDKASILVQGDKDVAEFYSSLATLRRRTRATWTLTDIQVVALKPNPRIRIRYKVQYKRPGDDASSTNAASSFFMTGSDLYTLQIINSNATTATTTTNSVSKILKIQQETVDIAGNSNPIETTLFMRSLVATIKNPNSAFLVKEADSSWFLQLWERVLQQQQQLQALPSSFNDDDTAITTINRVGGSGLNGRAAVTRSLADSRSDDAAATVYRILVALHSQGADLVNVGNATTKVAAEATLSSSPPPPLLSVQQQQPPLPGLDFMDDNVELLGYLGETLLRGKVRYRQNLGLLVSSLRSSLRSGQLVSEKPPMTSVEWTPQGTIQYTLTLYLRILLWTPFAPGGDLSFLRSIPGSGSSGAGLPLQITLRSEYVLDDTTGRIVQHCLLESLVNGQLTPADILSRWLQQRRGGGKSGNGSGSNDGPGLWSLTDFIKWVRTMSPNNPSS